MRNPIKANGYLVLFTLLAILIYGCKPEDTPPPVIPTGFDPVVYFNDNVVYGTMTDVDGNQYKTFTVKRRKINYIKLKDILGKDSIVTEISYVQQTWMAENLRTTKYRNGDTIANVKDSLTWGKLTTDAYCNYNNTSNADTIRVYGRLYNSFAVTSTKKLAPEGWHVADTADWRIFFDTTSLSSGYITFAGGKLKEEGLAHWRDVNEGATNETGFTALPAGYREAYSFNSGQAFIKSSRFSGMGKSCVFWTTSKKSSDLYQGVTLLADGEGCHGFSALEPLFYPRKNGFTVRCVKDY